MNLLVLDLRREGIAWARFTRGVCAESGVLPNISEVCPKTLGESTDAVAVRTAIRLPGARGPVGVSEKTLEIVHEAASSAPLHAPRLAELLRVCKATFVSAPVLLVSEASFFEALPAREASYGLEPELAESLRLRRRGYHGLFHQAASQRAAASLKRLGDAGPPRVLSICLEPKPEAAAVVGRRPLMVTGGTTPLEGLPGETCCGEMDAGMVLSLMDTLQTGPESLDRVLSRESGLKGLMGRSATLEEVFTSSAPDARFAAEVVRHRLLLACGAGVAAMGGVDALAFSGRYVSLASEMSDWLCGRLKRTLETISGRPIIEVFQAPLAQIVAEAAFAALAAA